MAVIETATVQSLICNEYFSFFLIMASSLVLTKIVHFILVRYLKEFVAQTKSDIDDAILKIITKPLCIFVVFTGFYFALKSLSVLAPYSTEINNVFFVGAVIIAIADYIPYFWRGDKSVVEGAIYDSISLLL